MEAWPDGREILTDTYRCALCDGYVSGLRIVEEKLNLWCERPARGGTGSVSERYGERDTVA